MSNNQLTDLQLRAQSRFRTGFPLSESFRNQLMAKVNVILEFKRQEEVKKLLDAGCWILDTARPDDPGRTGMLDA